jgi:lipopolysaccharide biosynthesis glycosyltransferase
MDDLGKIWSLNSKDFCIKPIYIQKNIFKRKDNAGVVYYKLLLHQLLDCDVAFHIDSDTVIVKDISDIFTIDITDYYCGAVKDKINGFEYFNAGNVLFNLKKIRNEIVNDTDTMYVYFDKINKELQDNKGFLWEQDVLNKAFKGKIKYIHYGFNFLVNTYSQFRFNELVRIYGEPIKSKNIKILHYASYPKPWKNPNLFGQVWKMYAEEEFDKAKEDILLKVACREFK